MTFLSSLYKINRFCNFISKFRIIFILHIEDVKLVLSRYEIKTERYNKITHESMEGGPVTQVWVPGLVWG